MPKQIIVQKGFKGHSENKPVYIVETVQAKYVAESLENALDLHRENNDTSDLLHRYVAYPAGWVEDNS